MPPDHRLGTTPKNVLRPRIAGENGAVSSKHDHPLGQRSDHRAIARLVVTQASFGFAQGGHVDIDAIHLTLAIRPTEHGVAGEHGYQRTILVQQIKLARRNRFTFFEPRRMQGHDVIPHRWRNDQFLKCATQRLGLAIPVEALAGGIPEHHSPQLVIALHGNAGNFLEERTEASLAFAQRQLGGVAVSDIDDVGQNVRHPIEIEDLRRNTDHPLAPGLIVPAHLIVNDAVVSGHGVKPALAISFSHPDAQFDRAVANQLLSFPTEITRVFVVGIDEYAIALARDGCCHRAGLEGALEALAQGAQPRFRLLLLGDIHPDQDDIGSPANDDHPRTRTRHSGLSILSQMHHLDFAATTQQEFSDVGMHLIPT